MSQIVADPNVRVRPISGVDHVKLWEGFDKPYIANLSFYYESQEVYHDGRFANGQNVVNCGTEIGTASNYSIANLYPLLADRGVTSTVQGLGTDVIAIQFKNVDFNGARIAYASNANATIGPSAPDKYSPLSIYSHPDQVFKPMVILRAVNSATPISQQLGGRITF
ncbi:hypothetical protein BDQ17DRAFT_1330454 [Cyathus striatus]|nr:hypothetical protein BDQ17DRAFT_1330454 [Cyathus striatus]